METCLYCYEKFSTPTFSPFCCKECEHFSHEESWDDYRDEQYESCFSTEMLR